LAKSGATIHDKTRAFWSKKMGRIVTDEDAREILVNISEFFRLLSKWDKSRHQQTQRKGEASHDD